MKSSGQNSRIQPSRRFLFCGINKIAWENGHQWNGQLMAAARDLQHDRPSLIALITLLAVCLVTPATQAEIHTLR